MLAKMPGDPWQKFANLRLLYAYMFAHPGKKLLFMGAEFGPWQEWNSRESLDWHLLAHPPHAGLRRLVAELNRVYAAEPALHGRDFSWEGFEWLDLHDAEGSTLAFLRKGAGADELLVCLLNFTPVVRTQRRVGVPRAGTYDLVLDTDAAGFGGSGVPQPAEVASEPRPWHGRDQSIVVTLPPLGGLYLRYRPASAAPPKG
jgi:1,4-alpha-glucan branching enzyme